MGLPRVLSGSSPQPPDPDPRKFELLRIKRIGALTVVMAHYPGCTSFDGDKVSVYLVTPKFLRRTKYLDPHFTSDFESPIARFKGDEDGWQLALRFAYLVETHGRI